MFMYPFAIKNIREISIKYKLNLVSLEELQGIIWEMANQIASLEEKYLRNFLMDCEGDIELIRFTKDDDKIKPEVEKVLDKIEEELQKWESKSK